MTAPQRIQRKRTKGWKMPPNTKYIGRGTIWGNPFKTGYLLSAKMVVSLFAQNIDAIASDHKMTREQYLAPLKGKNLACWCELSDPCHADVLLREANR
jgi:hypothetical protein